MNGQRLSHYEVIERVGSGGMGVVFRARDTRLQRDVALKLIAPGLGVDAHARERLVTEARAASMLDHPNVCTVYEIDEAADGALFIAMAYCPGPTLQERIDDGTLGVDEAAAIARQVAEGLAAAHQAGVVHRDVKPGNVILAESGRVKLVDFGLAKLAESRLTRQGEALGTTAYMAPEQIRGEPADTPADVWGFGVLLHQMLTRCLPFQAPYDQAVMYRILHEEPDRLEVDLPRDFEALRRVVDSCLQKDPALRPSMQQVLEWLRGEPAPAHPVPHRLRGRLGRRPYLLAALASGGGLVTLLALLFVTAAPAIPHDKHVVVLPLSAVGEAEEDELLADGLTVILTSRLVQLAYFTDQPYWVVPYTEVRGQEVASPTAARRVFRATLAVEGSVVRLATGVQMALSLIDTRTLRTIRSDDFFLANAQLDRLQEEVAERVSRMMRLQLRAESGEALRAGRTADPEALELFLQARARLERFERRENLSKAVELLQQAILLDPGFGRARASLGEAYWRLYSEYTRDELYITLADRELERALAIDERLAAAYVVRGLLYAGTGRPDEGVEAVDIAIGLEPGNADAYMVRGRLLDQLGEVAAAEESFLIAIELRPLYWVGYNELGDFYQRRGRYDDALENFVKVTSLTPDNVRGYSNLGAMYFYLNRFEDAAAAFERSIELEPSAAALTNLATNYYYMGEIERAVETYRRALAVEDGNYQIWFFLAAAFHNLGDEDESREALEQALHRAERRVEVNPHDQRAVADLAGVLVGIEQPERAAELLASLHPEAVEEVEVRSLVGETYLKLGDREAALAWLCSAVAAGYSIGRLERSPGLSELRADPRFSTVMRCAAE